MALRNLVNNKLHSAINIGGLAVGLAACLLILLFVRDELSYDRWVPGAERIAVVESTFFVPGRDKIEYARAPGPLKAALEKDFSSDIERVVCAVAIEEAVRAGDRQLMHAVSYVDPGFFAVFPLPMVAGERDRVHDDNGAIVLSQRAARRFFAREDVVGQTLTVGGKRVYTVVGVFRDLPPATHLEDLDAITRFDPEQWKDRPSVAEQWTSVNMWAYVQFRSAASRARVIADMPAFLDRNVRFDIPGLTEKPSTLMRFDFMPLRDVHLHATKPGYERLGNLTAVIAFSGIAALILLIACINFVNLATARAMKRAREVALRKVVGSTRGQLVAQHLGEAVLTAAIALVIAVALVELALPAFNAFLRKELRLSFIADPSLLLMSAGLIVAVGVLGGLYPAIVLSRFRPAQVLKANQSSVGGSTRLRSGLVLFQFAVSIALIACTATIYGQTVYARTFDLGFAREDRVVLDGVGDLSPTAAATLKRQLAAIPGVTGVALAGDTPPLRNNNNTILYPTPAPGEEKLIIETLTVDPDFFALFGVKPLAGRLFTHDRRTDFAPNKDQLGGEARQSVVINMAFARQLGAARPEDAIGKVLYDSGEPSKPLIPTTVIGVVPDVYLRSMRAAVTPLLYYARASDAGTKESDFNRAAISVAPGRMREAMAAIERTWGAMAPTLPIRARFVDADVAAQYDADEQRGHIFAGFALFAVLIACLGLFGLASFSAERRTKEIGMRKVLGASVLDIVRLLVWQFSRPVLIANVIAWPIAFLVMRRWLAGFRYAIDLADPLVALGIFGGAGVLALGIAWLTVGGHAYKVARANPGRALRVE